MFRINRVPRNVWVCGQRWPGGGWGGQPGSAAAVGGVSPAPSHPRESLKSQQPPSGYSCLWLFSEFFSKMLSHQERQLLSFPEFVPEEE